MEEKQFHIRTLVVAGVLAVLLLLFAGTLYRLQIVKGDEYRAASTVKIANTETVEAARGEIVDRYGRPLKWERQKAYYRNSSFPKQLDALVELAKAARDAVTAWPMPMRTP